MGLQLAEHIETTPDMGGRRRLSFEPADVRILMGDEKKTDDLEDVDGGTRLDGLILNEVEGGAGSPSGSDDKSLEDVDGGTAESTGHPLEDVDGGYHNPDIAS